MLVYYKVPFGVLCIAGIKIYGRYTNMPPTDISFVLYLQCKEAVEHATYRETQLSRMFKRQFPPVAFTYKEVGFLPEIVLDQIGILMFRRYKKEWPRHRKINKIKIILRRTPCH